MAIWSDSTNATIEFGTTAASDCTWAGNHGYVAFWIDEVEVDAGLTREERRELCARGWMEWLLPVLRISVVRRVLTRIRGQSERGIGCLNFRKQ